MTRDEAIAATSPYHDLFYAIVLDAWSEWRSVQSFRAENNLAPVLYKRVIANYVHDAIARRAIPAFAAQDRVTVHLESQTFKLLFGGLCARFKKGDENNLGCNVPTFAALAFEDQEGQLPGLPPETAKIDVIWRPNEIWTEIEHVLIVSRDGDELLWEHELQAPIEKSSESIFRWNTETHADESEDELVKPKASPAQPKTKV